MVNTNKMANCKFFSFSRAAFKKIINESQEKFDYISNFGNLFLNSPNNGIEFTNTFYHMTN